MGIPRKLLLPVGIADPPLDLTTDPVSGDVYGPPALIGFVGAGEVDFHVVDDPAGTWTRWTGADGSGWANMDVDLAKPVGGSSVAGFQVLWT